jgi:hypothetical protein
MEKNDSINNDVELSITSKMQEELYGNDKTKRVTYNLSSNENKDEHTILL